MSRSRKKVPIVGVAGKSDAPYKKQYHKKERLKGKERLRRVFREGQPLDSEDAVDIEHQQERFSSWDSDKDGKLYWPDDRAYRK